MHHSYRRTYEIFESNAALIKGAGDLREYSTSITRFALKILSFVQGKQDEVFLPGCSGQILVTCVYLKCAFILNWEVQVLQGEISFWYY